MCANFGFRALGRATWQRDMHGRRMTALGKLLRTTAFKLTLVYLTVFAMFAAFLLAYFAWNTRRLITEQITQTVDAEITGLAEQYRQGGIRRLVFVVDARSRRPGSSLYLVTTRAGEGLAGNVGSLATGILETSGWTETAYRRLDDPDGAEHHALIRVFQLPAGFRLLVGRDLELDRLSHQVTRGGEEIVLQPREFRLLEYLMKHAGQVVTRTMLLENVWDYHFDPQTNVIDVHISRLRSKIDKGFTQPLLHTVRGAGYMVRDSK